MLKYDTALYIFDYRFLEKMEMVQKLLNSILEGKTQTTKIASLITKI